MGFQTTLTLKLLSKTIINPDCCEGKYPHVNMVNESVIKLFETCGSEEKQNNLQIVTTYSNLYACVNTKLSRDSLKCASVKKNFHFSNGLPSESRTWILEFACYPQPSIKIKSTINFTLMKKVSTFSAIMANQPHFLLQQCD